MQRYTITKGATSQIVLVSIYDSSSSTGGKLTGLVYNSAGLTAYYYREGAGTGATAITLATATLGTYTSGGFIVVDGTNMPGDYELHIPNAALATGADRVLIQLKGATNMVPVNIEIDLTNVDLRDGVRGGMTALPNAVPGASGGVFIAGTNAATTVTTSFTTTFTGNLTGSVGSVTTVSDKTGYALSAAGIDAIFDEAISGHLTSGTVGLYLAIAGGILVDTTLTGTPSSSTFTFTGGVNSPNFYQDKPAWILTGTGIGQAKPILTSSYLAGTTTLTFDETYDVVPANGDRLIIQVAHVHPITQISSQVMADLDANGSTVIDTIASNAAAILADTVSFGVTKNAAFSNFEFLMVDGTDFATPKTGLTVTGQRSIDGGAFAAVSGTIAEVGSGIYQFDALAADTNGDVVTWKFSSATAADRFVTIKTRA